MAFSSLNQYAIRETQHGTRLDERRKRVNDLSRLIARKTVSFSLSENYDFLPSLLGFRRIETSKPSLALSEENLGSPVWCSLVSALRTKFSNKSVLDEPGMTP